MVYCLILLVELTPKQHLALGIAVLSAGGQLGGQYVCCSYQAIQQISCLFQPD
jgi:hypothetical protein